jgi:hypothetical protein
MTTLTPACPDAAQADALANLVELEARWMNVPVAVPTDSATASLAGLVAKQKAFEAYRAQKVAYNQRFHPAYHGQRPVTTAVRLAAWCRTMADLFRRAGQAECPVNVLEQAHRCADRLGSRLNRDLVCRSAPGTTTADAIAGLGTVAAWCDSLLPADADGQRPTMVQAPRP